MHLQSSSISCLEGKIKFKVQLVACCLGGLQTSVPSCSRAYSYCVQPVSGIDHQRRMEASSFFQAVCNSIQWIAWAGQRYKGWEGVLRKDHRNIFWPVRENTRYSNQALAGYRGDLDGSGGASNDRKMADAQDSQGRICAVGSPIRYAPSLQGWA